MPKISPTMIWKNEKTKEAAAKEKSEITPKTITLNPPETWESTNSHNQPTKKPYFL